MSDLEIVLEENADAVLAVSPCAGIGPARVAYALGVKLIHQEVREALAGEPGGVVPEEAQQPVVAGVKAVLLVALQLAAHLQLMTTGYDGQVVAVVEGIGDVVFDNSYGADVA